jgi:hydroxymethylbilane synthase
LIRIGSRGSQLALWQANHIAAALRSLGHSVAIEIIKTTGDAMQSVSFAAVGTKGMFTKEIEEALADGRIDVAVHSLKDLPTDLPDEFAIAAVPLRADPRDALVSLDYDSLVDLPVGSKVGTSSLRRQAQLRYRRPDLEFVEFRGNVDTRLRKLAAGQVDACVLACAGLDRLGFAVNIRERFSAEIVCPAPGQGALAIECRSSDEGTQAAITALDHAETHFAVDAERAALRALGGGCLVPIGALCEREGDAFVLRGTVAEPNGARLLRATARGIRPEEMGAKLAASLLEQGAAEILGNVTS